MPISDEISYEELKALVEKSSNLFLVDVRNKDELEKGRIPGSVHIPGEILYKITVNMRRIVTLQHVCMLFFYTYVVNIHIIFTRAVKLCTLHFLSFQLHLLVFFYAIYLFFISVLECVIHTSIITYPAL